MGGMGWARLAARSSPPGARWFGYGARRLDAISGHLG